MPVRRDEACRRCGTRRAVARTMACFGRHIWLIPWRPRCSHDAHHGVVSSRPALLPGSRNHCARGPWYWESCVRDCHFELARHRAACPRRIPLPSREGVCRGGLVTRGVERGNHRQTYLAQRSVSSPCCRFAGSRLGHIARRGLELLGTRGSQPSQLGHDAQQGSAIPADRMVDGFLAWRSYPPGCSGHQLFLGDGLNEALNPRMRTR